MLKQVYRMGFLFGKRAGNDQDQRGQAAVEFALLMPLFLVVLMIIVNFGFVFSTWINMVHGAREGARAGAVGSTSAQVQSRVTQVAAFVDTSDITVARVDRNGNSSADEGDSVQVKVRHTVNLIMPSILGLNPNITLCTIADMRLETAVTGGASSSLSC